MRVCHGWQVGEHAGCGPGLLPTSGFTYSPETFMEAKIGFYNFSWRDMGVPTLDKMMDIVQVSCRQLVVQLAAQLPLGTGDTPRHRRAREEAATHERSHAPA